MNKIWKWVDRHDWSDEGKIRAFLLLNSVCCGLLGLLVWLILRNFAFHTVACAICFVGYPGFFVGLFGGFIFLCRNM